ncbi:MAG: DUF695 domain-containing protein [Planctomycetota bacterium]
MNDERWDFYPCRVDDAPASILVGFHLESGPRPSGADTLHVVGLEMEDPAEHGMGSQAEAETLWPVEDALVAELAGAGFVHVGRLRNRGTWQISFYGPASATDHFLPTAEEHAKRANRDSWTHVKADPDWSYYATFLLPDAERRHWIKDRALVATLQDNGDRLVRPRTVDHDLAFPSSEAFELFFEAAELRGFRRGRPVDAGEEDGAFAATIQRDDPVELEHIHRVVMDLVELAAPYDGSHTGWGCTVETER